jgi:hypothetical protein
VIQPASRPQRRTQHARRLADDVVDEAGAHRAHPAAELLGRGQVHQRRQARLAGWPLERQVEQVVDELVAVRDAADRIDAADRVLQLDLRHHHRGQVGQAGTFGIADRARFGAEHAHRAQAVAVAREQGRAGVEAHPVRGQVAVAVARVGQEVGDHQHARRVRHFVARRLVARDRTTLDADARLEPLAVDIGERYRRHRQAEQLGSHPRDAVERFVGRRVEQVELAQCVETGCFQLGRRRVTHGGPCSWPACGGRI